MKNKSILKARTVPKSAYYCINGPLKGHTLYLANEGNTLPLRFGKQVGRYIKDGLSFLTWETINEGNNSGQT